MLFGDYSESCDSSGFCQWVWTVSDRRSLRGFAVLHSLPVSCNVRDCDPWSEQLCCPCHVNLLNVLWHHFSHCSKGLSCILADCQPSLFGCSSAARGCFHCPLRACEPQDRQSAGMNYIITESLTHSVWKTPPRLSPTINPALPSPPCPQVPHLLNF